MKRTLLNTIVKASYSHNELDAATVEKIASHLSRRDLKQYIRGLKKREKQMRVVITGAQDLSKYRKTFEELYPEKKLVFEKNQELLLGMKIINDDIIYELNLKNTLQSLGEYIYE